MKVRLFGILAEEAGTPELELDANTTRELVNALGKHIQRLEEFSYSIAVDHQIVHDDVQLSGREEIAILPPFAGG